MKNESMILRWRGHQSDREDQDIFFSNDILLISEKWTRRQGGRRKKKCILPMDNSAKALNPGKQKLMTN